MKRSSKWWQNTGSILYPDTFFYVDIGMYCCFFIMLFQIRIAAVHNLNI